MTHITMMMSKGSTFLDFVQPDDFSAGALRFPDAWKFGFFVWQQLHWKHDLFPEHPYDTVPIHSDRLMERMWELQHDKSLPLEDRICLIASMHEVYTRREHWHLLAAALQKFHDQRVRHGRYGTTADRERELPESHLPSMASLLKEVLLGESETAKSVADTDRLVFMVNNQNQRAAIRFAPSEDDEPTKYDFTDTGEIFNDCLSIALPEAEAYFREAGYL